MKKMIVGLSLLAGLTLPEIVEAQGYEDEIIVTGSRVEDSPGIFLEKRGDFLLLSVSIVNDSRERSLRIEEMMATVDNFLEAARSEPDIELSIIDDNDFVRPMTRQNFRDNIYPGSRPDTSVVYIKVKTQIPDNVEDSYALANKLSNFVEGIEEEGRTNFDSDGDIAVSVVDPYQYRADVRDLIVEEINTVTTGLGGDYGAIIKGLDGEVEWARSGDINLIFYMDYEYELYPKSISSITNIVLDDY